MQRNPYLRDSLLLGEGGQRTISKVTPSFVHNTVDNPIFPNSGKRLTGSIDFAGLGGNTNFLKPRFEYAQFKPLNRRMSVGYPRAGRVHPAVWRRRRRCRSPRRCTSAASTRIRGYDIRSIGPRDSNTGARARRQQDAAVQRRVPDQHRRPGAPGAVLRHRPGPRHRRRASRGRKTSPSASIRACRRSSIRSRRRGWSIRTRRRRSCGRSARPARSRPRPAPRSGSSCRC